MKNELYAKRKKLVEDMHSFLDSKSTDNGHLSAEDDVNYSKMEKDLEAIDREITRAEKLETIDKEMKKAEREPLTSAIGNGIGKDKRATDDYKKLFSDVIRRRKMSNALQEDTNSEGGYLVPLEFERRLFEKLQKVDPIFTLAGKLSMGAHEKVVPIVASYGTAALISEEGQYQASDPAFSQVAFKAYKFGKTAKVSEELIADSAFDLEAFLQNAFAISIGKAEAEYFWIGTGSSQPQGVLTGAGSGVTAAAQNKITADEIIDLYFSVAEQYRANANFVFNDSTMKEIRKLKDGNGQYLWAPGLATGEPGTILGKPCYTSENIPTIAHSAKIGVFGDLSNYLIGDRQGITFKVLNELYAENGQIGYRAHARTDGHVMNADAIKSIAMA